MKAIVLGAILVAAMSLVSSARAQQEEADRSDYWDYLRGRVIPLVIDRKSTDAETGATMAMKRQFDGARDLGVCSNWTMPDTRAVVLVEAPAAADLANEQVAQRFVARAYKFAAQHCSNGALEKDCKNFLPTGDSCAEINTKVNIYVFSGPLNAQTWHQSWSIFASVKDRLGGAPLRFDPANTNLLRYVSRPAETEKLAAGKRQQEEEQRRVAAAKAAERERQERLRTEMESRRRQEDENRQRADQAKLALQAQFTSSNGVQAWVTTDSLLANPFVHKGKIVGIRVNFRQMLTEQDALFGVGDRAPSLFVTSVPSTLFKGDEAVVLAIKVLGTKPVRMGLLGEQPIPYGEFVGVYVCKQNCSEFFK